MEAVEQLNMMRRLAQHLAAGTTDLGDRAVQYSASSYVDEDLLAAEMATLFRRYPVVVGCTAQLREPGDYITHDETGVPILVVRQQDGTLKAFQNICRHRGAKLVSEPSGHFERMVVCPYHAWSYETSGRLQAIPCASHVGEVDKSANGLNELQVMERGGLVFVVPQRGADPVPESFFSPYIEQIESFGLAQFNLYDPRTVHGKVNWKMMIEANRENYHIHTLHKQTSALRYVPQVSLFDSSGPHTRIALPRQTFSAAALDAPEGTDPNILQQADIVYFLFPNTLLLFNGMAAHALTSFPDGAGKTVVRGMMMSPPGAVRRLMKGAHEFYWFTIMEDVVISEPIQVAAAADPDQQLWLGANEALLAHFHASIRQALESPMRVAWPG